MKDICNYIISYEYFVWEYLSDVFKYGLKASELGFTFDLIYRLTDFYLSRSSLIEVYATQSRNEKMRGADIDLFIRKRKNEYLYFMLQAKIMDYKGQYYDISKWGNAAQFNILIKAAKKESAFPVYLLYNGMTINSRSSAKKSWGLSLVEATEIRNYRKSQFKNNTNPSIHNLTYDVLNNIGMKPFHYLFCKRSLEYELPEPVNYEQIYKGFPYNRVNTGEGIRDRTDNENNEAQRSAHKIIKDRKLAPVRIIINEDEENSR